MRMWGYQLQLEDSDDLVKTATVMYLQSDASDVSKVVMEYPYDGSGSGEYTGQGHSYQNLCDDSEEISPEIPDCLKLECSAVSGS